MSEIIKPPTSWKYRLNKTSSALTAALGDHRILSVKALLGASGITYSAVTVKDEGLGKDWTGWLGVGRWPPSWEAPIGSRPSIASKTTAKRGARRRG